PGVGAIREIDEPAVVDLHVVRLDGNLAAPRPVRHAPLAGALGGGGDVEGGLARRIRIAHVDGAHAAAEIRDEDELAVEDRRKALAAGVRAEAPAPPAEAALRLRD